MTTKEVNSLFSQAAVRPQPRRTSLELRAAAACPPAAAAAAVTERPASRIVFAFKDQEPAKGRLVPAGSDEQKVLVSWHHSLFGYPAGLDSRFAWEQELGKGGNAVVRQVRCRQTGKRYACKSIKKELEGDQWSNLKKRGHLDAVRQEVDTLRKLRGSLNVASLEDVYEDSTHVHIITELCAGGELVHRIGNRHYSERTVASYMRAVLRTIAQCHSQHLLHRDIKPGNFLLLNDDEQAPLKAIDFGLAVRFDPNALPMEDLGLEGTPWYQAPEVLSSKVGPAADVWSAGVMAFQLLTGRFPFDDKRNPFQPSVTKIWQSILCDRVDLKKSYWEGISEEGRQFVAQLLEKDPAKRPTAKEALKSPWLQGHSGERSTGKQLSFNVVQRLQRYSQSSVLKRTALQLIAEDMLSHAVQSVPPETGCPLSSSARPILAHPRHSPMQHLFQSMQFGSPDGASVTRHHMSSNLQALGYRLDANETESLMDALDAGHTGSIGKAQLAASQIDWRHLQQTNMPGWLEAVQRCFSQLDADGDGVWSCHDILECLQAKLSPSEVESALQQAMQEAAKRDDSMHTGLNFESFVTMLRSDSRDSLEQYDDRVGSSADGLCLLLDSMDSTCRSANAFPSSPSLESILEVN